jgi:hypothetical protein
MAFPFPRQIVLFPNPRLISPFLQVSGPDPSVNNSHHILAVNPKTSKFRSIAVLSQDIKLSVAGAPSAFDPVNNLWWSELVQDGGISHFIT